MHTEETEQGEYRVWLAGSDIQQLLDHAGTKDIARELAFALAARSGLRSEEITAVTPSDVHHDDTIGWLVTIPDGKGGKHRESPTPAEYAKLVTALGTDPHEPVIDVTTRTLRNWIAADREELAEQTDDRRWHHVSMHDLRRSWGGQLRAAEADPAVVLEWGGWSDMETFLDHYRGASVPEAQRQEREKIEWL